MKKLKIPKLKEFVCFHNEYGASGNEPLMCYRCFRPLKMIRKIVTTTIWDVTVDLEMEKKLKRKKK